MKKRICLLLCMIMAATLTGCGGGTAGRTSNQSSGVNDVLKEGMEAADRESESAGSQAAETAAQAETAEPVSEAVPTQSEISGSADGRQVGVNADAPAPETQAEVPLSNTEGIDIDLTALSSTMVYSEVFSMMSSPENYVGKNVKMGGIFAYYLDEATGIYYFACIVQDATACCSQGIEFVLEGEHTYPDDYPEPGDQIEVTGVFDTYTEGDYTYCTLRDAKFV